MNLKKQTCFHSVSKSPKSLSLNVIMKKNDNEKEQNNKEFLTTI